MAEHATVNGLIRRSPEVPFRTDSNLIGQRNFVDGAVPSLPRDAARDRNELVEPVDVLPGQGVNSPYRSPVIAARG